MDQARRIALYGGTFDPVHLGHVEIARRVLSVFELDELLFIPAQRAPHKLERPVTSALHRYAMLALATTDDPRLLISTFELDARDRRYTVDTLAHFRAQFGQSTELFFIMGADSWSEITTWRNWDRLVEIANHIVVTRPGYDIHLEQVAGNLKQRIVDLRGLESSVAQIVNKSEGRKIYITDLVSIAVSATAIREAARAGRLDELRKLVPLSVANYLGKYELYKNPNEA